MTHAVSVAERTEPALVACTDSGPDPATVTAAVPFAPVVAVTPPNATVAPAAGAAPAPSSCSTLTVTVAPGAALAGTPVSRKGSLEVHAAVPQSE